MHIIHVYIYTSYIYISLKIYMKAPDIFSYAFIMYITTQWK